MAPALGRCSFLALVLSLLLGRPAAAAAETRLHGRYEVSLAGIGLGEGYWDLRIGAGGFSAAGGGGATGLASLVAAGKGEASAAGTLRDGRPVAEQYDYASTTRRKYDEVRLRLAGGAVVAAVVDPPPGQGRKRVRLGPEHRTGVMDPVSGLLFPRTGPIGPAACARRIPVFDGRMRYDLELDFIRMAQATTEQGYRGPAAVCRVRFVPIAGHVPDRPAIRYLAALETMELWLAPVAGTGLAVPWKVVVPTPFGTAVMQAVAFAVE